MERTVLVRPARAATLVRQDGQFSSRGVEVWLALAFSAGGDGGRSSPEHLTHTRRFAALGDCLIVSEKGSVLVCTIFLQYGYHF
jgi:hypothetical protein